MDAGETEIELPLPPDDQLYVKGAVPVAFAVSATLLPAQTDAGLGVMETGHWETPRFTQNTMRAAVMAILNFMTGSAALRNLRKPVFQDREIRLLFKVFLR